VHGDPDVQGYEVRIAWACEAGGDACVDGGYEAFEDSFPWTVAGTGGIEAQAGAEQDLVVARVLEGEVAVGVAAGAEPCGGVCAGLHGVDEGVIESLEPVGDHGLDQVAEVGEMPVDRGRCDPGLARDGGQGEKAGIAG
jgi:hypothetical protein